MAKSVRGEILHLEREQVWEGKSETRKSKLETRNLKMEKGKRKSAEKADPCTAVGMTRFGAGRATPAPTMWNERRKSGSWAPALQMRIEGRPLAYSQRIVVVAMAILYRFAR
jgi:hypothetical protein